MTIKSTILEQIRSNSSELKDLNLEKQNINVYELKELVEALANNTNLTSLNVDFNDIGDEGAEILAASIKLQTLKVCGNQITDKGAKALAKNSYIRSLSLAYNSIEDEGAEAFASNNTLVSLSLYGNSVGYQGALSLMLNKKILDLNIRGNYRICSEVYDRLEISIKQNFSKEIRERRNNFFNQLIVLARDTYNKKSRSYWSGLPKVLMVHIISLIEHSSEESIGKSSEQINACANFVFNNEHLGASLQIRQSFKLIEKIKDGKSYFKFFSFKPRTELKYEINANVFKKK